MEENWFAKSSKSLASIELNENELMLVFWFIYFGTWTFLKESAKAQVQAYQMFL